MTYLHRNGETKPPTQPGHYGHREEGEKYGSIIFVTERTGGMFWLADFDADWCKELPKGQWWGPITGPWEDNA